MSAYRTFIRFAGLTSLAVLCLAAYQLAVDRAVTVPDFEIFASCVGVVLWLTGEFEWRRTK